VPYRFLDDAPVADVGFVASGGTLDVCFQAAADATLAVMLGNPEALAARQTVHLHVEAESLELALLRFLEEFIYYKDAQGLLLRATAVRVSNGPRRWQVDATAAGEPIDPSRHLLAADVKAVTLHRLRVSRGDSGAWEATVVLDI
jgi:SHS2 domain-containing protein